MCNSLASAQAYYSLLKGRTEVALLHAGIVSKEKNVIEEKWTRLLGEEGYATKINPERGVLISTQILEQSVNIDGCEMFTEHTSIAYLLQRIARIHRFDSVIRDHLPTIHIVMSREMKKDYDPRETMWESVGSSEMIYSRHLLYRTYHKVLKKRHTLETPSMTRALIDEVDSEPRADDKDIDYPTSMRFYNQFCAENEDMYSKSSSAIRKSGQRKVDEEMAHTRLSKVQSFTCVIADSVDLVSRTVSVDGETGFLDGRGTKFLIDNSLSIQDWKDDIEKVVTDKGKQSFLTNKKVDVVLISVRGALHYLSGGPECPELTRLPFRYDKELGLIKIGKNV
jgi:hypothetical protein